MEHTVRLFLIAAVPALLYCSSPASAQQLDYVPEVNDMSTVPIGATSPLGIDSSSMGGTGIPLGAIEIKSAGVSPLATYSSGTIALSGSGTTCPTPIMSQPGVTGSADAYDGGGMAMGSTATATAGSTTMTPNVTASGSTAGMSAPNVAPTDPGTLPISGMSTTYATGTVGVTGMCSADSNGLAASPSTPTSTAATTPGGNPRVGIPLGSSEIANLGVGSWATIPTPLVSPFAATPGTTLPTVPTMPVATTLRSTPTTTTTAPASLAASTASISGASGFQSSISGIPILVPGLAGK
jgi:hypothetical protein